MVSATQWSAPVLERKALDLISTADSATPLDPTSAAIVQAAGAVLADALQPTPAREIGRMVTKLANIYRQERGLTEAEASARLQSYCQLLSDIPPDLLSEAFKRAGRTCKFFPTVAELRGFVSAEFAVRCWRRSRAAWLVEKSKQWRPDPAPLSNEEIAALDEIKRSIGSPA